MSRRDSKVVNPAASKAARRAAKAERVLPGQLIRRAAELRAPRAAQTAPLGPPASGEDAAPPPSSAGAPPHLFYTTPRPPHPTPYSVSASVFHKKKQTGLWHLPYALHSISTSCPT